MSITIGGAGVRMSGGIVVGPSVGVSLSGNDYAVYLLRDDFTDDWNTALTSPRTAEPGPGTLTLVQTDGQFSIANGKLNFPAQASAAWGDQGLYGAGLARQAGRALLSKVNRPSSLVGTMWPLMWGASADAGIETATSRIGLVFSGVNIQAFGHNASSVAVGENTTNVDYTLAVTLRATGAFYFVKGGAFANWTLLWVDNAGTLATLYPKFTNLEAAGTLDTFRVRDLPAPFDTDTGLATAFTASPSADATITSEANAVIEFTWTAVTSETLELSVRRTDDDNRWIIRGDQAGSTVKLIEEVAGVETERASAAQTWTNNTAYRVVVVQDGNVIRGYVANVLKWTYSSASFNNTATGVKTNKAGANLAAWPRQLSGAAATILDQSVA